MPPILICIAHYESGTKQFSKNGSPLWSPTGDVGIMQIHYQDWHSVGRAHGWGFVHNEEDNISMALYIYKVMGPKAWATYSKCKALDSG